MAWKHMNTIKIQQQQNLVHVPKAILSSITLYDLIIQLFEHLHTLVPRTTTSVVHLPSHAVGTCKTLHLRAMGMAEICYVTLNIL